MVGKSHLGRRSIKFVDETLYCERCGISFLWTSEEQSESDTGAPAQPTLCPGCRYLLPQPGRERGLVKWFSHKKRYGFIARADHGDLFFHRSELVDNVRLHPGDLLEFSVGEGKRGPAAIGITVLKPNSPAHSPDDTSRND